MTTEQQIDRALAYFTDEDHPHSFELLEGTGHTLISAPHAVLQTRNGSVKCAERFTGMLCRMIHDRIHAPVIYKTRHLRDDANHDPISDYRDALCRYVKQHDIRIVLDLHQMKPERKTDVCIGTGRGRNLMGRQDVVELATECFRKYGVRHITVDEPFDASGACTVCATTASRCCVPALQIEINTRLLMSGYEDYCFIRVMDALCELTTRLNSSRNPMEIAL
ncbi:MAG: N-formylglutamate amidohydrolase [Clostridiales bacterium]|nr:N-formylglutamate amidohydrolase [Clostridiales bacterium]